MTTKDDIKAQFPGTSEETLSLLFSDEPVVEAATEVETISEEIETVQAVEEATIEAAKEPEYSESEKAAIAKGWDPTGDKAKAAGKPSLSADEFLRRGELFERIDGQKKEIYDLKKTLQLAVDQFKKTEQLAYDKAMRELISKREEAIKNGDLRETNKLDSEMAKAYQAKVESEKLPSEPEVKAEKPLTEYQKEFKNRNAFWLDASKLENTAMLAFAQDLDSKIINFRKDLTEDQRLTIIEGEIKRNFADRFENTEAKKTSPVLAKKEVSSSGTKKAASLLNADQEKLGKRFVQLGAYKSLEEFAQDLKAKGAIK